jgi:hypothetical protein
MITPEKSENKPFSISVAQNTTDDYFVSTAMWTTKITGMLCPTYETFIWEWKPYEKKRSEYL